MTIVPATFLFRYALPVQRVDRLPRSQAPLLKLPESCSVPWPSRIEEPREIATLSLAWNPQGFAVQIEITGKKKPPQGKPDRDGGFDAVMLWIDTRDTHNQHRASRFCHHFGVLPSVGGKSGSEPVIKQLPVPRAREDAPAADPDSLLAEVETLRNGYRMSLWFPAESLHGYDPATQPRLGFYLVLQDRELGSQVLTVNDDFPYDSDPSQWITLELLDAS